MSLFETLLEQTGKSKVPLWARESYGYRGKVVASSEFRRIKALPRRDWRSFDQLIKQTNELTALLKQHKGAMKLFPIQAQALIEIWQMKGAFLPIGVGQGKTLISLLGATVLSSQRPVLFVPASLRSKALSRDIPEMIEHWQIKPDYKVIGYSELSLAKNADMLNKIKPDLVVLDECHYLKNKKAGRTKRMVRYFKENPNTVCVAMSGTISNRSLKDWSHIAEWCLGQGAPVPLKWQELCDWSDALDEKVPKEQQIAPGALLQLCKNGENARQGFRRRLDESYGVVASRSDELGTSLNIHKHSLQIPDKIKRMIHEMRNTWETPNGDIITEAVELWRHIRELSLGFWYRWDPSAPKEWMEARRVWKKYVREVLKHNRRGLDTELQVWNECEQNGNNSIWQNWKDIKDTFKPNSVAQWEHGFALDVCASWLTNVQGICWVEQQAFGKALSEVSGFTFFGSGNNEIINTKEPSIIASIRAHGEGKNLQKYSQNLITCPPSSGKVWEQLLGRTHRQGQEEDEVICEVFLHVYELEKSFEQAQADACYLEDTYGNKQKLNYANIVME